MLTDEQIDAMTATQRRALILRLARPAAAVLPPPDALRRTRGLRLGLMVGGVVVLIPWIGYLAVTLPKRYVATHWNAVWIGFDLMLLGMLALTAWLGWRRRQLVVQTAFATGVLLACDAWFDILTAQRRDLWPSLVVGLAVELPVAAVLISGTLQVITLTASRLWLLDPGMRVWQVPLLVLEGTEPGVTPPTRDTAG